MQFAENFIAGKCAESVGMRIKMFLKKRPVCDIINRLWRVVRVVDRAALEMLCPLRDPGFESLTLRQKACNFIITGFYFACRLIM